MVLRHAYMAAYLQRVTNIDVVLKSLRKFATFWELLIVFVNLDREDG